CFYTCSFVFFFFQAEDGIRDGHVTGVQTCALPISGASGSAPFSSRRCSRSRSRSSRRWSDASRCSTSRSTDVCDSSSRLPSPSRSEERRVGKECRSRWWGAQENKKGREKQMTRETE